MLTLEEKLRVAAMYIGAPVSFFNPVTKVWSPYRKLTPSGLVLVGIGNTDWKLQLFQLTVTKAHMDKVHRIYSDASEDAEGTVFVFQYLISLAHAVPLWFGINHWANNKTAIELGLAEENHSS